MEKHEALVKQVLARLERHDLAVSLKKSVFQVDTVEFLGYIVGKSGVTMSEKKVESILNWKAPRSVKDIPIFIGFANFYRRFIENFSKICKPITDTLKTKGGKHLWYWGEEQDKAFEELKRRFTSAPILAHFYPDRKTIIETDASDFALVFVTGRGGTGLLRMAPPSLRLGVKILPLLPAPSSMGPRTGPGAGRVVFFPRQVGRRAPVL